MQNHVTTVPTPLSMPPCIRPRWQLGSVGVSEISTWVGSEWFGVRGLACKRQGNTFGGRDDVV